RSSASRATHTKAPCQTVGKLPNIRQAALGSVVVRARCGSCNSLLNQWLRDQSHLSRLGIAPALPHGMTNAAIDERTHPTPACTLEEARQLIDELRAEYQMLSTEEKLEVRWALEQAAQSATGGWDDATKTSRGSGVEGGCHAD